MDKATEVKKVASKPKLEGLQAQVNAAHKKIDMLLKVCERHFGVDIDRDGKIADVAIEEGK